MKRTPLKQGRKPLRRTGLKRKPRERPTAEVAVESHYTTNRVDVKGFAANRGKIEHELFAAGVGSGYESPSVRWARERHEREAQEYGLRAAVFAFTAHWPRDLEEVAKRFARSQPCLIHGKACGPAEPHHFPRTKASGKNKSRCMMIPLCWAAHRVFHDHGLWDALHKLIGDDSRDLVAFLERLLTYWAALSVWLWEHRETGGR